MAEQADATDLEVVVLVYEEYKCYGPYVRKDNRMHMVLIRHNPDGSVAERKTVSYPKYLVEVYLDRYLTKDETIDHIDEDITNNELSNLRVVPRSAHCRSHVASRIEVVNVCPICGKTYMSFNNKTCGSKSCRGKCAHLDGYNKGNSLKKNATQKQSLRSTIEEIQSVNVG